MKKLMVLLASVGIVLGLQIAVPESAQAAYSGYMNSDEWEWIDVTIPDANTQAEAENHCNCTGVILDTYNHNGNPAKTVQYHVPDPAVGTPIAGANWASVDYVKRDGDIAYHAFAKTRCWGYKVDGQPYSGCLFRP